MESIPLIFGDIKVLGMSIAFGKTRSSDLRFTLIVGMSLLRSAFGSKKYLKSCNVNEWILKQTFVCLKKKLLTRAIEEISSICFKPMCCSIWKVDNVYSGFFHCRPTFLVWTLQHLMPLFSNLKKLTTEHTSSKVGPMRRVKTIAMPFFRHVLV